MTREELFQILRAEGKVFICDVIVRLIEGEVIDITDFNTCYINTLQKKIDKKDKIIQEADNCMLNSLYYDSINKTDSTNVILDKVRWMYKYANTNKEELCKMFKYDPLRDTLIE